MISAEVSLGTREARVQYLPSLTDLSALDRAIESTGYKAVPAETELPPGGEEDAHEREYRRLFNRFLFAAVISVPALLLGYPEVFPYLRSIPDATMRLIEAVLAVLTLAVMAYSGSGFYRGAWSALRHRSADMNTLVALGTGAAWLYSVTATAVPQIFPARHLAALLRRRRGGYRPRRARPGAGDCGQRENLRGDQEADGAAGQDGPGRPRRRRDGHPGRGGPGGRPGASSARARRCRSTESSRRVARRWTRA